MNPLYHIVESAEWARCCAGGLYEPASFAVEGFIHFSTREQLLETANAFFRGRSGLWVLEIEISPEDSKLKWESAVGPGDREGLFPHYYGRVPVTAVAKIYVLERGPDGRFLFPSRVVG